ncbi:antibiotic biosynthesis monooxygenase [Streptomyces sp. NPDC001928]|uniref:putative quinol monooxygenase n=1 Tax=Streptomyces sp. NPDC001928 TaxID=3154404 RepID=UPI00332DC3E2
MHAIETSAEPGFLGARVFAHATDPGAFYSVQEWESAQAFRAHMAEAAQGMAEATAMLSEAPRTAVRHAVKQSPSGGWKEGRSGRLHAEAQ